MVDGVVDIPLPGRTLTVDAASCRAGVGSRDDAARRQQNAGSLAGTRSVPNTFVPTTVTRQDAASTHFLAGPENRLVEVAVRSVVEGQPNGYNPLVLYGPSGTGKSHLALGLAAAWKAADRNVAGTRRVPDRLPHTACADYIKRQRVVCITAVDFARELADAIETQAVEEFRAKHRGAAMLVVEDLGQLATRKSGKLSAQEELVHTLDALVADGALGGGDGLGGAVGAAGHCAHVAKPADGGVGGSTGAAGKGNPLGPAPTIGRAAGHRIAGAGLAAPGRWPERHGPRVGRGTAGISMPTNCPAHGVCRLHQGLLTWRQPGNILRGGAAAGRRVCTSLPWPRRGISRCGYRTSEARRGVGRWSRPAAWPCIWPGTWPASG